MEKQQNGTKIDAYVEDSLIAILRLEEQVLWQYDGEDREEYGNSIFTDKEVTFEILSEEDKEIDIQSIEGVDGFKLIEAPYMAKCLSEGNFDTFTDLLKQSELEFMNKIEEVIKAIKQLDKK